MSLKNTTLRRSAAAVAAFGIMFAGAPAIVHAQVDEVQTTQADEEIDPLPEAIELQVGQEVEIDIDGFTEQYAGFVAPEDATIVVTGLPRGLTYDYNTRIVSGTPLEVGEHEVTGLIRDGAFSREITIPVVVGPGENGEEEIDAPPAEASPGFDDILVKRGEEVNLDLRAYWDNYADVELPGDGPFIVVVQPYNLPEGLEFERPGPHVTGTVAEDAEDTLPIVRGEYNTFLYHVVRVNFRVVDEYPEGYDPATGITNGGADGGEGSLDFGSLSDIFGS